MADSWKMEPQLREDLFAAVPAILDSQDERGRFGVEPWICQDQNVLLSLAAAWSLEGSPCYRSAELLEGIARGGEALTEDQDEAGMWTFRKKDHSTWGQIYMPWTYSRWIRAYRIVGEALPPESRRLWEKGSGRFCPTTRTAREGKRLSRRRCWSWGYPLPRGGGCQELRLEVE